MLNICIKLPKVVIETAAKSYEFMDVAPRFHVCVWRVSLHSESLEGSDSHGSWVFMREVHRGMWGKLGMSSGRACVRACVCTGMDMRVRVVT